MVDAEADKFDEELNISNRDDDSDISGAARAHDFNKVSRVQGANLQHPHGKKRSQKLAAQEKTKVRMNLERIKAINP
jgi:hypothetical protein